jgi:hypothetical protein
MKRCAFGASAVAFPVDNKSPREIIRAAFASMLFRQEISAINLRREG